MTSRSDEMRIGNRYLEVLISQHDPKGWLGMALRELAATRREWRPIETAPYGTSVLAWLHLPKNPIASAPVIAQRCYVERDDPESYSANIRQTVGCWWANGMYYPAGQVTHWMPLPAAPTP